MSVNQHPTDGTPIKDEPKVEEVVKALSEEVLAADAKAKADAEALVKKKKK